LSEYRAQHTGTQRGKHLQLLDRRETLHRTPGANPDGLQPVPYARCPLGCTANTKSNFIFPRLSPTSRAV
jgi:murein tripeptide amidase MpaA